MSSSSISIDLIGPYAAPAEHRGFWLSPDTASGGIIISAGRYYVDGILVESQHDCPYGAQPDYLVPAPDAKYRGKVRRWDQRGNESTILKQGAVPVKEGVWLDVEDGIQIKFGSGGEYRTGDYWLIPARVATGGIEWPATGGFGKH